MPQLSAIVITRNEAANIGECLDSVASATSASSSIAAAPTAPPRSRATRVRASNARVAGFGAAEEYALSLAQRHWVLSIDADERVTPGACAPRSGR